MVLPVMIWEAERNYLELSIFFKKNQSAMLEEILDRFSALAVGNATMKLLHVKTG